MSEGHVGFIAGVVLGGFAMWLTPWVFFCLLAITAGIRGWDYWDDRRARKARESAPRREDLG